ncbi:creatininase family protein [Hungatella hathewayi]|nr:creatininase family protein [Hungatella hathewayi]
MEWKNMLPYEFNQALEEGQICILPVGSLERHGEHIPYGCDAGIAEKIAVEAARLTPAVVFPTYYFGQIHEAAMHRGAVNFPAEMLVTHLRMLLDQIAYNGFRKIMIINGHGGNRFWLQFLEKTLLDYKRNYCLYIVDTDSILNEEEHQALDEIYETKDGHAGETETSVCMAAMPGCVDLSRQIFEEPIHRMGRMDGLKGIYTGYYFNADWAEGVTGTPSLATEEKGKAALDIMIKAAARAVKTVQEDQEIPKLQQEILEKCGKMEEGRR